MAKRKRGVWIGAVAQAAIEDERRASERRIALRFLKRAVRRADRVLSSWREAERAKSLNGVVANAQLCALWRVVVAASHKSGTFDGKGRA